MVTLEPIVLCEATALQIYSITTDSNHSQISVHKLTKHAQAAKMGTVGQRENLDKSPCEASRSLVCQTGLPPISLKALTDSLHSSH